MLEQEAQDTLYSARPFARWNWYSFMDNGNVAEVTAVQSAKI